MFFKNGSSAERRNSSTVLPSLKAAAFLSLNLRQFLWIRLAARASVKCPWSCIRFGLSSFGLLAACLLLSLSKSFFLA